MVYLQRWVWSPVDAVVGAHQNRRENLIEPCNKEHLFVFVRKVRPVVR